MRELNLDQLRTLVTVTELGSLAAAARALHLAPPTVSLHVTELESRLGATLLLRQRQPVVPTPIGQTLVERGRRLLAEADAALDEVSRQVKGRAGRVGWARRPARWSGCCRSPSRRWPATIRRWRCRWRC